MIKKLTLALACFAFLLTSCSKCYDFSDLDSADVNGEIVLSLASASYTIPDLLKQFNVDTLLNFDEDGGMHFLFNYDLENVVDGTKILCYKDADVNYSFTFQNPYPFVLPEPVDTTVVFMQTISLESDNIGVLMAEIRSGHFDFEISSNIMHLNQVIIHLLEFEDVNGNELQLVYNPSLGQNSLDLSGVHFETVEENTIHFMYEVSFTMLDNTMPELNLESTLHVSDVHIREMFGWVKNYASNSVMDTTFKLFSDKFYGVAGVCAANIKLRERNGFQLDARFQIDTAMVWGEGVPPYQIFNQMPVFVDVPSSPVFNEVFSETVHGKLNMTSNTAYASGIFVLNPDGEEDMVMVSDTSTIDVKVDVDVPCSFNVENLLCADTVDMNFANASLPEVIEEITLGFDFLTDLPFNMSVCAFMYDSVNNVVMDTLVVDQRLQGSFDGSQVESEFFIQAVDDRVDKILKSDHIILNFLLDTDSHDAMLNRKQNLSFDVKADVKYVGNVEF